MGLFSVLSKPHRWMPAPRLPKPSSAMLHRAAVEREPHRHWQQAEALRQTSLPKRDLDRIEHLASGIPIQLGDRWVGYGTSGTGKTTAFRQILLKQLELFPEAVLCVIDSNPDHPFQDWPGQVISATAPSPPTAPGTIQVWRPTEDDADEYERYLDRILNLGPDKPVFLHIDELSSLAHTASSLGYPRSLAKLLKMGRAAHKSTSVLTQDAAYILRQVLGQSTHVLRWRMQLPSDSAKLNPYFARGTELGPRIADDRPSRNQYAEPRRRYAFWHVHMTHPETAKEYASWRSFV